MSCACKSCGTKLTADDRGLYRKLISRESEEYLCISCLAAHFKLSEEAMREKAKSLREMGCGLFY